MHRHFNTIVGLSLRLALLRARESKDRLLLHIHLLLLHMVLLLQVTDPSLVLLLKLVVPLLELEQVRSMFLFKIVLLNLLSKQPVRFVVLAGISFATLVGMILEISCMLAVVVPQLLPTILRLSGKEVGRSRVRDCIVASERENGNNREDAIYYVLTANPPERPCIRSSLRLLVWTLLWSFACWALSS